MKSNTPTYEMLIGCKVTGAELTRILLLLACLCTTHQLSQREAYVTMVTHPSYIVGAEVLARTLLATGTERELAVMVAEHALSDNDIARLYSVGYSTVYPIREIPNPFNPLRRWFTPTLSKLNVWNLTDFYKVIWMDCDMMVISSIDDLFDRPLGDLGLAAVAEGAWFNSGLMVLLPSRDTFEEMLSSLTTLGSYDGGDQGFLNVFFSGWYTSPAANRLPLDYNTLQNYAWEEDCWRLVKPYVKVFHFCGQEDIKPWGNPKSLSLAVAPYIWVWRQIYATPIDEDFTGYFQYLAEEDEEVIKMMFQS